MRRVMTTRTVGLVLASGLAAQPAPAAPVRAFGLPHEATGNAVISVTQSGVVITGIGASGLDGAHVALGDADGWRSAIDFGPAGALTLGSRIHLATTFLAGGAPGAAALTIEETDGGLAAVRLDEVGCACAVTVELRLDGAIVDDIVLGPPPYGIVATGALGTDDDIVPTIRTERTTTASAAADRAFVLANLAPTPITLAGSAPTTADEIRVRLDGVTGGVTTAHAVTVTAANIDEVTLASEAIVQFGVDHAAELECALELAGAIDKDGDPDVVVTNAGSDPLFLTRAPDTPTPVGAVDLRLRFVTEWPDFVWFERETQAIFSDGSARLLTRSALDGSGSCGCAYLGRLRTSEHVDRTVVGRLDGVVVASAELISDVAFLVDLVSRPEMWSVELVPHAPAGVMRYREVWRWDAPASVRLYDDIGQVVVDEVEVTVEDPAGALGPPVALGETFLGPWGFVPPTSFIIDGITHRPLTSCPGDITGDGEVGFTDLVALLAQWGACSGCPTDLDGDGTVGVSDLLILLVGWGACAG